MINDVQVVQVNKDSLLFYIVLNIIHKLSLTMFAYTNYLSRGMRI